MKITERIFICLKRNKSKYFRISATSILFLIIGISALAGTADTAWMTKGKYGIFMHYQFRILLGYGGPTKPVYPDASQMKASQWNQFVVGFDAKGFADQMAKAKVGWVMFGLDDGAFGWPCAPNKTFSKYTGYAPGKQCSNRDLIMDVADALNSKGIKVIVYYAGFNGYMRNPKILTGLSDTLRKGVNKNPSVECRKRHIAVFKEYADRYKDKIAGWWFDGMEISSYNEAPYDMSVINSIVHNDNPKAVIAFSYGPREFGSIFPGIDNYTGGDTWSKQDLVKLTPKNTPADKGILWHGKIYCGNVYHGMGNSNQFSDQELITWIKTCNSQGGICTLDWPFDPKTGLIKDFGIRQMINIGNAIK
jgi:hypothetical protein